MAFQEQVQQYCDKITALTGVRCTLLDATEKQFCYPFICSRSVRRSRCISPAVRKRHGGTDIICTIVPVDMSFLPQYCASPDCSGNMP